MALAGTAAVNTVMLFPVFVVVRDEPARYTVELPTNPLPFTVNVNAGAPANTEFGLKVVIAGAAVIVKVDELDVPPPDGFDTVTLGVPAMAMYACGTVTTIWLAVMVVGVSAFWPVQPTVAPLTNPLPEMVIVNEDPPADSVFGVRLEIAGADPTVTIRLAPLALKN
jgi:hypothetical protein